VYIFAAVELCPCVAIFEFRRGTDLNSILAYLPLLTKSVANNLTFLLAEAIGMEMSQKPIACRLFLSIFTCSLKPWNE